VFLTLRVVHSTASFSLYTYSISVALQALTVIAISKEANDPTKRKSLLVFFTLLGSISCLVFLTIQSRTLFWSVSALLTILGNVAFGASIVCLNAYLPTLAKKRVQNLQMKDSLDRVAACMRNGGDGTDYGATDEVQASILISKATSHISSKGIGAGYAAGISLLLLMLIPVTIMKGSLWSLRIAIACSGVWWLGFSIRESQVCVSLTFLDFR